jgi:hypothetical protein
MKVSEKTEQRVKQIIRAVLNDNRFDIVAYKILDSVGETKLKTLVKATDEINCRTGVNRRKDIVITDVNDRYVRKNDCMKFRCYDLTIVYTHVDDLYSAYNELDVLDCDNCGQQCIKKAPDIVIEQFPNAGYNIVLKGYECYREQCYTDNGTTITTEKTIQYVE